MAEYIVSDTNLQAVANAIRTKGGTSGQLAFPSGFVSAIEAIPSGGGGSSPDPTKPVKFIDYDGTLLYSYTAAELQALSALPANPSHAGLTAQGWNWTLAEAKAQLTAMPDAGLTVGQNYVTSDGKTRLYCRFTAGRLSPCIGICPNGTVTVDWGDGSSTDTLTGTVLTNTQRVQHTYAAPGDYVITLTPASGTEFAMLGNSSNYGYLLTKSTNTSDMSTKSHIYRNALKKVELGTGVRIGNYAFYPFYSLETVTIPKGATMAGQYIFRNCYSLKSLVLAPGMTDLQQYIFGNCCSLRSISLAPGMTALPQYMCDGCQSLEEITIPSTVTSMSTYAFQNCYSLQRADLPSGITSVAGQAFNNCYSLSQAVIPSGATSIGVTAFGNCNSLAKITVPALVASLGTQAFYQMYGVREYHFLPTTPPAITNKNVFSGIVDDCVIYVPYSEDHSVLEAYQTASIWTEWAAKMQEEPA